jgi:hypothetical protein
MVLHRHHHRPHHSVGYIGWSGDEQKIASRHPRSRHGVLASETTVAESPSFYTDCGNVKRFPRRSPQASGVVNACTFLGGSGGVAWRRDRLRAGGFVGVLMMIALAGITAPPSAAGFQRRHRWRRFCLGVAPSWPAPTRSSKEAVSSLSQD